MKYKKLLISIACMFALFVAFFLGAMMTAIESAFSDSVVYELEETVLVSRSPNWKTNNGFYAAVISLQEEGTIYNVVCKIHIANMNYFENIPLGKVKSKAEAYSLWGEVQWTDDALIIGTDSSHKVTIKRSKIETHR